MLLEPTDDQAFFRETTARFLGELAPPGELRRRRDDPDGFDAGYWRRGADLGWTSLLVGEDRGGGTISGQGLVDLTLVAHEFGAHAAPGPLVGANLVAAALARVGPGHEDVLAGLIAGTSIATWAGMGAGRPGEEVSIRIDGDDVVVDGATRPVESAGQADHLLVSGRTGAGLTQVLVPTSTPGIAVTPMQSVDLTRRFGAVRFDGVRVGREQLVGDPGGAAGAVEWQRLVGVVLTATESVGAMQTAFDMTVEWAFDRYSFGRPLASYQALKHRFADMLTWLEAGHAVCDEAAAAASAGSEGAAEVASSAKAWVGQYGSELLQDCVQLHGGIGMTFEHDLHLYLRRHTVDRAWFGTPAEHLRHVTDLIEGAEVSP